MVRFKQRYIVTEIIPEKGGKLSLKEHNTLKSVIKDSIKELYGDYGLSLVQSNFYVKYLNQYTRTVFIRVARGAHTVLINALNMIRAIDKTPLMFRTLHVAGSIRLCQKFLVRHNQAQLRLLHSDAGIRTETERRDVERSLATVGVTDKADILIPKDCSELS